MPRPIPVPNDLSKPFWDAANQKKLVLQNCTSCNLLQYPPTQRCTKCRGESFEWKEVPGKGHTDIAFVIRDSRLRGFREMQPVNFVVITLDADPGINFLSNLRDCPIGQVPLDAPVEMIFEETGSGQMLPEWKLV
jgi:uncharacterized OB-fold protein